MPRTSPQLTVRALQPVAAGLEALGLPVASLLAAVGIPTAILEDPDGRVPHGSMMALWKRAQKIAADECLGLHVALAAPVTSFDVHAYAVLSSPTLRDAFGRASRYQRLIHETSDLVFEEEGDVGTLRHGLPGGRSVPRQPAEFLVASWLRFGRLLTGRPWMPNLVCFDHPAPDDTSEHRRVFGPRVRFRSGQTAMRIAARILDEVNPKADATLLRLIDSHADTLLEREPVREAVSGKVEMWLTRSLGAERPTAAEAARALHVSARTLRRHLRHEGTTYRELLDSFRHRKAVALLESPRYGIADVAFLLGFSELSAFYRAFRRWTGSTPAEFRDRA